MPCGIDCVGYERSEPTKGIWHDVAVSETTSAPDRRRRAVLIAIAAGLGITVVTAVAIIATNSAAEAEAQPPSAPPTIMLIEETPPPGLELADPGDLELLGEPMDLEVMQWQTDLQTAFSTDPNFGSVSISPDRSVFTITWHGAPSHALNQQIAAAPDGLEVVIQPAAFPPGELQLLVAQAMKPGFLSGVRIALGTVENDGSGIHLGLAEEPDGQTLTEVADAIADALGRTDVPIRVEVTGAVIPLAG